MNLGLFAAVPPPVRRQDETERTHAHVSEGSNGGRGRQPRDQGRQPGRVIEAAKPEGAWFAALDGKRTMVAVFDLASPADIPPLAEPFFIGLNAAFELCPAMDATDLKAGLSRL